MLIILREKCIKLWVLTFCVLVFLWSFFSKQFSAYCPSIIHWAALNWCGRHAILLILTLELTLALSNLAETAQLPGPRLPPCKIRAVLHPRLCKIHCVHSGKKQATQPADDSSFCSHRGSPSRLTEVRAPFSLIFGK